jgi:4-hydroxy-tetrahydrodipicolinate reductase
MSDTIKVIVCGALGRMGRAVIDEIAAEDDLELAGAVEVKDHPDLGGTIAGVKVTSNLAAALKRGDVLVDFTNPEATLKHIKAGAKAKKPVVTGTTGLSQEQLAAAEKVTGDIPLVISPNMSAGVNLMFNVVERVTQALPDFDIEIVEIHHNRKKDSPSGTAARLADVIETVRSDTDRVHGREGMCGPRDPGELALHSLRGGDVVGEHTVIFAGEGERFELTHRAHSRRTFARGTIRAIRFIVDKKPGLYTMADILGLG